jgi:hypothetical protein
MRSGILAHQQQHHGHRLHHGLGHPTKKPLFLNLGMTLVQEGSTLWRYWELVGLLVEEVAQRVIPEENNWSQKGIPACNSPALDLGQKPTHPVFLEYNIWPHLSHNF